MGEQHLHKHSKKSERKSYIYFIASRELKMVKIGYTFNIAKRFGEIQQACPVPLFIPIVIKGGKKKEKELHIRFSEHHSHREWYRLEGKLDDYIHRGMREKEKLIEENKVACDCNFCFICDL